MKTDIKNKTAYIQKRIDSDIRGTLMLDVEKECNGES